MYGRKACQLVKEFACGEKGQLTPFNNDLFYQVVAECSQHHGELQSLIRFNRAETIRNLLWKIGPVIPKEIEEKLNHWEEEYFKKHSAALKSYMSKVLVDLTGKLSLPFPPSPPFLFSHRHAHLYLHICERY
ncbi:unnamed protein product [Trifolium pratense]|uniref:Uncharacterized protein n=1 Tax=Trifolium pratense TaxID=57577 RepID=A0ACB0J1G4_TRIPR|nr:unnamed protein product [Trifolium pratense]